MNKTFVVIFAVTVLLMAGMFGIGYKIAEKQNDCEQQCAQVFNDNCAFDKAFAEKYLVNCQSIQDTNSNTVTVCQQNLGE